MGAKSVTTVKCPCGWTGDVFEILVSMDGDRCPQCEEILPKGNIKVDQNLNPILPNSDELNQTISNQ